MNVVIRIKAILRNLVAAFFGHKIKTKSVVHDLVFILCNGSKIFYRHIFTRVVSTTFDVSQMISSDSCVDIYLDERKIPPPDMATNRVISHGFTPATTIDDFPIRGKAVHLHIRRLKWLDTERGKVLQKRVI